MNHYTELWCQSARKCKPIEDWHWQILERDYQIEFDCIKRAFIGSICNSDVGTHRNRGETWEDISVGARKIADALAAKFQEHGRCLPYINTLWLVP